MMKFVVIPGKDAPAVFLAVARKYGIDPALALDDARFAEFCAAVAKAMRREQN